MTFRVLDVNLDRAAEGLRVPEDVARFSLNDTPLTERVRVLRRRVRGVGQPVNTQLMSARDAGGDVGAGAEPMGRATLGDVVNANAKRVQERLGVLEELAQLPSSLGPAHAFQEARFEMYALGKRMMFCLAHQEARKNISGLYVIIDTDFLKGRDDSQVCRQVLNGGARVVQLRDKARDKGVLLPICQDMAAQCAAAGGVFLVNDHLDLVLASGAQGLHVGQTGILVPLARHLLPVDSLLGVSAKTRAQSLTAQRGWGRLCGRGGHVSNHFQSGSGNKRARGSARDQGCRITAGGGYRRHQQG